LSYLEESVLKGAQWVVFEPNQWDLWAKVKRSIIGFVGGVCEGRKKVQLLTRCCRKTKCLSGRRKIMSWLNFKYPLRHLLCVLAILFYGCATYKPPDNIQTFYDRVSQKTGGNLTVRHDEFKVQCIPIVNERMAKTNLGIHPVEFEMLPVFLRVENTGQNPIKVDLPNSFITIGEKQTVYLDIDSVVGRIAKKDEDAAIGFGFIFGMLGGVSGVVVGVAAGTAIDSSKTGSGTVGGHYYRQSFNPVFIHPNNSGGGLVFYHLSKEDLDCEKLTLSVPIIDLNSNNISNAEFTFNPADFKNIKEDRK
jgi:hypothetical protein